MLENRFYQDFGSLARVLKYAYSVFFLLIYFTTQPVKLRGLSRLHSSFWDVLHTNSRYNKCHFRSITQIRLLGLSDCPKANFTSKQHVILLLYYPPHAQNNSPHTSHRPLIKRRGLKESPKYSFTIHFSNIIQRHRKMFKHNITQGLGKGEVGGLTSQV